MAGCRTESRLATLGRIKVGKGAAAITRAGDGLVVNMVTQAVCICLGTFEVDGT